MPEQQLLTTLIRKRGALQHKLNNFKTYIQSLKQLITDSTDLNELQVIELQLRLTKFEPILLEFDDIQSQIESLIDENDINDQYNLRETFENSYYQILSLADQLYRNQQIIKIKSEQSVSNSNQGVSNNSQGVSNNIQGVFNNVKLPTIQLPKFKGYYEAWLEFKDTFESLIHTNTSIDNIQKFHYLRARLEGRAAEVIQCLDFSASNYDLAWELLCNRYDNKRLLVQNHIKSIFDQPSLKTESALQLRQLIDTTTKHLRSLKSLKLSNELWVDTFIIYIISNKLDKETAREWEQYKGKDNLPTLEEMNNFLKSKADLLETLQLNNSNFKQNILHKQFPVKGHRQTSLLSNNRTCNFCKGNHFIYTCRDFLKLNIADRIEQVRALNLCANCLRTGHIIKNCKAGQCRKCNFKHNTLLHLEQTQPVVENHESSTTLANQDFAPCNQQVLLSTASVQVTDSHGNNHVCRALLDCGSQSNFITQDLYNILNLQKTKTNLSIVGINRIASTINSKCTVQLQSNNSRFCTSIPCFIIPSISDNMPSHALNVSSISIPNHLKLADPLFYKPGKIDMLIGAGLFWKLLKNNKFTISNGQLTLQQTQLGWIISGSIDTASSSIRSVCHFNTNLDIQDQLKQFWEIETCSLPPILSKDENDCESHFTKTFIRNEEGRFVVSIPFKESLDHLGDSKTTAQKRFYNLERKFQNNSEFKNRYISFMSEYETLGHMSKVIEPIDDSHSYYLPHHGVLKEDSLTTSLRVVFDGSAKTDTGFSLNDIQLVGPTIQDDLLSIILRFRTHQYVISADIAKMYRQVLINPSQRSLQRILWRSDPNQTLSTYQLNTVTYGTASAPFLAIRCLKQLAIDNSIQFSSSSRIIERDFYVDDLLTGSDSIESAITICKEISHILSSAGFELRKWVSNDPTILQEISASNISCSILSLGEDEKTKTLGLQWASISDVLMYKINDFQISNILTKRALLSDIGKIFDPLGLLGPCTIISKIMLQRLWSLNFSWDDPIPHDLLKDWFQFKKELSSLKQLKVLRHAICKNPIQIELHGFSDASQDAYGACIYLRSVDRDQTIHVNLLCAKTKVAPLKSLTIPRLELCGALLLAQLSNIVKNALNLQFKSFLWCDSQVTLCWIKTQPNQLKTFVSNRVSQIQSLSDPNDWHYVESKNNPADLLSRGVMPSKLLKKDIWWSGPAWLNHISEEWPMSPVQFPGEYNIPELRNLVHSLPLFNNQPFPFSNFSSFTKLKRVTAYCLRFIKNCKTAVQNRQFGNLSVGELEHALKQLVKMSQLDSFQEEIKLVQENKSLKSKSQLSKLSPFIDSDGILRVGGRLQLSNFSFDKKHPFLLSGKHYLTKLLFRQEHIALLHAGPQQILYSIRNRFWPTSGRNVAKKTVFDCTVCFKAKPKQVSTIMGNLPQHRTSSIFPFFATGVDYAGPFFIKDRRARGSKLVKCYICLFVCFATRAIHLETVTDLTKDSFIAALRRFTSRRGKPLHIYSDNGTNFVGANAELKELSQFLQKNENTIANSITNEGINWHFIPAHSPHFGGLWEAGVKSTKYHLKRVIQNASLTFEDFTTVLIQIEGILNSRPICPISSDPTDLEPLTPAHLLIGRSMTSVCDPNVTEIKENRLSRFQYLQRLKQHFWERWTKEYISELQQRAKWRKNYNNLTNGTLVLLKEDNLPTFKWKLGRVIQLHPGQDGVVRVASVKTQSGIVKRAVAKMCPLPQETITTNT